MGPHTSRASEDFVMTPWIFVINVASTWFMTGLIWFVQVVHYPLFSYSAGDKFQEFEVKHCDLTGTVVVPAMVTELMSSFALALLWTGQQRWLLWLNFVLLCIIWICTATLSVPCHSRFCSSGYSGAVLSFLVGTNWIRTILWTGRGIILAILLGKRAGL